MTYAKELRATIAAFRDSAALLDVQQSKLAAGSLNDSGPIGSSIVTDDLRSEFSRVSFAVSRRECCLQLLTQNQTHGLRRR